jgi:hypothetical protein
MGTDGACGLLFCAAKRSGTFPPNMPETLTELVSKHYLETLFINSFPQNGLLGLRSGA